MFPFCLIFGCPHEAEKTKKYLDRAIKAEREVARLKERMIEEGINEGGSILVTGQKEG
jgi:hypothetical protein